MAVTENELLFLRLLERTKRLTREDLAGNAWKVRSSSQYLTSLLSKMQDEKSVHNPDILMQYGREVNQLNMLVEAEAKKNVEDKLAELEKIPSNMVDFHTRTDSDISEVSAVGRESTSEIRLRNKSVYRADLRKQLLGDDSRRKAQGHVEDISRHEEMQEDLANELLNMTRSLKRNMEIAGDVIKDDNKRLIKMSDQVDSNKERLQSESTRLAHHAYKMKSLQLLKAIRPFNRCSRYESTSTQKSKEGVGTWLESVLPSESFITKNIRNSIHKQQLSNRMTELHLFHETFPDRQLPKLDNSSWLTFFKMHEAEERAQYLLEISKQTNFNKANDGKLISEFNEEKDNRNEMVYAPGFHGLLELQGKTFRRLIDNVYGSRLLSRERLDESLPKLVVDCRFLNEYSVVTQSTFAKQINGLQNVNWTSKNPFHVIIANFVPDRQLADIVKRTWHFRYGPDGGPLFRPHPFSPTITSRGLKEAVECSPDSIMYISWRAKEFLPDIPPPNVKAAVLCASTDYQPWSSSLSAAQKDGLKIYRLPVQKYSKIDKHQKVTMSLQHSIHVLSEYFSGNSLSDAIRRVTEMQNKRIKSMDAEIAFVEAYRKTCEPLERELDKRKKQEKWLDRPTQKLFVKWMEVNGTEVNSTTAYFALGWTREQAVTAISFAYVVISILMVLLWSMYLCIDGRRTPRKDTRVIHMLAQRTLLQSIP